MTDNQSQAYNQTGREGLSSRERAQERRELEFGKTEEGHRIQELEKTVETMWRWIQGFKGQSGVRATGNIVELENPQALGAGGAESGGNPVTVYLVIDDGSGIPRVSKAKLSGVELIGS